ncbi:carboxypeptidase-like regulatory domain-containing protein [Urechidicola vernalis]|uniref:Carboxypeptidase-like regulatory domain-containing protein n=1 Tax=Urechidicola vernalis TaxID=3075600 RepID=A0ABU2Y551_9FLAO|nr:carboxypeptidase-like regulatory domain-containing protein [Urechidicola sp. P050]MDT0553295.1 carboxypeptidase-like regulatory domain-containing protein [Urechidicola sp. P050]
MKKSILLFLFFCQTIGAQNISGHILDIKTKEPLVGATIYLDGTSIGTTSDFEGYFQLNIELNNIYNANVIISFIGFETRVLKPVELEDKMSISLTPSTNSLKEIELQFDLWSRSKKMHIFKREFLGNDYAASRCKIENEKDIVLIHNSSENTLTAHSNKPIKIINKYLGYEIYYSLMDFEIEFSDHIFGSVIPQSVYYIGTSFYNELNEKTKKSVLKNRNQTYSGSLLHFMRALVNRSLTENDYIFYRNHAQVDPYKYFEISEQENLFVKVSFNTQNIGVTYKEKEFSNIKVFREDQNTFYIDQTGNHSPANALIFSGVFGQKRMSTKLPLNFNLN